MRDILRLELLGRIKQVRNEFKKTRRKSSQDDLSDLDGTTLRSLSIKIKTTITELTTENSEYRSELEQIEKRWTPLYSIGSLGGRINEELGVLDALEFNIENDYIANFSDLIRGDLFSDYLEMASHLLEEKYRVAAAVIAGVTLETHLKDLAVKNEIDIEFTNKKGKLVHKKADSLNSELAKKKIYSKNIHKQITAWLGIRNSAAHGKDDEFTHNEVKLMIDSVSNFIA